MSEQSQSARLAALQDALQRRILVLDGAMGTLIQSKNLKAADFGGAELEGCNENLVLTRPDVIRDIHAAYFAAGADIAETNTFGATPLVLAEYGLEAKAREINARAAELAREAARAAEARGRTAPLGGGQHGPHHQGHQRHRRGDVRGAGGDVLRPGRGAGRRAASDYFLIETCPGHAQRQGGPPRLRAGLRRSCKQRLPVAVSGTIEPMGTMLAGQSVEALATSLEHVDLLYLGPQLRHRSGVHDRPHPLAGGAEPLPGGLRPQCRASRRERPLPRDPGDAGAGAATLRRGAAGSTSSAAAAARRRRTCAPLPRRCGRSPRAGRAHRALAALSGVDYLEVGEERAAGHCRASAPTSSALASSRSSSWPRAFEDAGEVARAQVKRGAQIWTSAWPTPTARSSEDMRRFLDVGGRRRCASR